MGSISTPVPPANTVGVHWPETTSLFYVLSDAITVDSCPIPVWGKVHAL